MNISILPCVFGQVLIAYQDNNLIGIELGKDADQLYNNFVFNRLKYTNKNVPLTKVYKTEDSSTLTYQVLLAVNEGKALDSKVFLTLNCSPFRKQVLTALQNIPVGKTATYKDVAIAIGNPNAVRAVGTACGENPIAIVIPCHRIIRSNGDMGEYRWGKEIKKQLLKRESDILLK